MEKKIFWIFVLTTLFLLACSSLTCAELTPPLPGAPSYINIDVEKANEMLKESPEQIILLDVRTEEEYSTEKIPGAINIPLPELENRMAELDKSKTLIVHDQSGDKCKTASGRLAPQGFIVYNMQGGIDAWKAIFTTSTSTPAPTSTPASTPAPAPASAPASTSTSTPTQTSVVTPSPVASPAVTHAASPTPAFVPTLTPTPTESSEKEKGVPGFEAPLAITMLLVLFVLLRRK